MSQADRTIYLRLGGAQGIHSLAVPVGLTGQRLRKLIKESFLKLDSVSTLQIVFPSSEKKKSLPDQFFETYSTKENCLQVWFGKYELKRIDEQLFEAKDQIGSLAIDLRVPRRQMIRSCYESVLQTIYEYIQRRQIERLNNEGVGCNIFLTGTPGIGKTTFLIYLIQQLMGKYEIAFVAKNVSYFHQWDLTGKYSLTKLADVPLESFRQKDKFFIADSCEMPQNPWGIYLICSSPRDEISKNFRQSAKSVFMPVWTYDEVIHCHETLFKNSIDRSILQARFFVLGGIPRFLFDNETPAYRFIDNAIQSTTLESLQRIANLQSSDQLNDVAHALIHRFTPDNCEDCEANVSSQFAAIEVLKNYTKRRRGKVLEFLADTADVSIVSVLRGQLFEPLAHTTLARGVKCRLKELNPDGTVVECAFESQQLRLFPVSDGYADIVENAMYRQDETLYFRPMQKNFECIDSWIVKDGETWAFQYTVGRGHKISSALYWYNQFINVKHYVTVVYDPDRYDMYKHTNLTRSKKKMFKDMEQPPDFSVRQYVMLVTLQDDTLEDISTVEGYESFIDEPELEGVKMQLGLST